MRSVACLVALAASFFHCRAEFVSVSGFTSLSQNYENVVPFSLYTNALTATFTAMFRSTRTIRRTLIIKKSSTKPCMERLTSASPRNCPT